MFRLSRLLEMHNSADQLRTEVDMIERWWQTADGPQANLRDRRRLLVELSDAVLAGKSDLEIRFEPAVVEALIGTGTLRELSLDRVAFRHDVLRDWGLAARIHEMPEKVAQLPLDRTAPAWLVRGVELAARFSLERSADGLAWKSYLISVSKQGADKSWRRWSILAILRSESASNLLNRASAVLFENDGDLLQELIRVAYAVESRPLSEMLEVRPDAAHAVPESFFAPSNASWFWLILWLLERRAEIPLRVLPDVVTLFRSFSVAMLMRDKITPKLAETLVDWLEEIEDVQGNRQGMVSSPRFGSMIGFRELQNLATDIRQAFSLMASLAPNRAQAYLNSVIARPNTESVMREILKFRGSLAKAAPAELVQLTLAALLLKKQTRVGGYTKRMPSRLSTQNSYLRRRLKALSLSC
jgi:hypothetical protein